MLALDTLGMFQATTDTANQLIKGIDNVEAVDELKNLSGIRNQVGNQIENIVVIGMGGSGIVGDLVSAIIQPEIDIPIKVVKSYELPAFVNQKTLLLAISFSGETQETLKALESAIESSAQIVAITTGGKLTELASKHNFVFASLDKSIPQPRAGLAEMTGTVLSILGKVGIFPKAEKEIKKASKHLEKRILELSEEKSPAHKLAQDIDRTIPLVLGASDIGVVAAKRWKCQINENVKSPAFFSEIPEAFHNELAGWGLCGDVTRQVFSLIQLRSDFEMAPLDKAFSVALEMQGEAMSQHHEVRAQGDGILSQLFDLILFGDFVSLYLAGIAGVDPGPIPAIDDFKLSLKN